MMMTLAYLLLNVSVLHFTSIKSFSEHKQHVFGSRGTNEELRCAIPLILQVTE